VLYLVKSPQASARLPTGALFVPELAGSALRQHVHGSAPDRDAVLAHGLEVIEADEPSPLASRISRPTHSRGPVTCVAIEERLVPSVILTNNVSLCGLYRASL
jgi:hypothetical protein